MSNPRKKTIHVRLYLAYCICALLVYVLLMAFVLPWWHVSNQPVVFNLGAGSAQKIGLQYSPDEDPMILVPVGEQEGFHWKWATELPPRPSYDLKLVFPEGTESEVIFKQLELVDLTPTRESRFLNFIDINATDRPDLRLRKMADGIRIYAEPGGSLNLNIEATAPSAYTWLQTWARASFVYLVLALVLLFTLATFLQFPDRVQSYRKRTPAHEVALLLFFAVAGSLIHMHLLNHSMPVFVAGESDSYVTQAIQMASGDNTVSMGPARPGYAYFIAKTAGAKNWDMNAVILSQGIVFCIALALAGLATNRLINAWLLGPVLLLAYLSPPAIWSSRHIGVESLTVSVWLIAIAAFLYQWQREKWNKWLGFVLFGLMAVIANFITSAGLLMLFLPVGFLVGTLVWSISIRRATFWKLEAFWRSLGQVSIPILMVLAVSLYVSLSRSGKWDLFSFSADQSAPSFHSGMFEVSAIQGNKEYESIINQRIDSEFSADWSQVIGEQSLVDQANEMLPLQAKWVSWGRLAYWGLFIPDVEVSPGNPLRRDYTIRNNFASSAQAKSVQDSIADIMRETGQAVFVMEKRSNRQLVVYNQIFIGIYRWFFRILFFLALAAWLIGLSDRKLLAGLFVLCFLLNILWRIFSLNLGSEVIQSMDSFLWLGALAGLLGANSKSLQKPTDETDRRTMRPIRPTRLLTRHNSALGAPKS